jgi:hypothetical protein
MRETVTEYEVEQREIETERIYCDDCGTQTDDPTFEAREVCDRCRTVEDDSRIAQTRETIKDILNDFSDGEKVPFSVYIVMSLLSPLVLIVGIGDVLKGNENARDYLPVGIGNILWGIVIGAMIGVFVL